MRDFCTTAATWICTAAFAIGVINPLVAAPFLPLYANMDSKTVGMPIGTGGAALGEPTALAGLTTLVTQTVPGQNRLQVSNDLSSSSARRTRWQLAGNANVNQGVLIWSFDFTPSALDKYSFLVREANTSTAEFVSMSLNAAGNFSALDQHGSIVVAPLTYAANVPMHVVLQFDMDAGTADVLINGSFLYSARLHGVSGIGAGALSIGYSSGSAGKTFVLDNVQAIHEQRHPIALDADLETRPLNMPIGAGGAAVGEPVSVSAGLVTSVQGDGSGGRELSYASSNSTNAQSLVWQWLNSAEFTSGQVVISLDVQFPKRDTYGIFVRESGGSAKSFLTLYTSNDGRVQINGASGNLFVPGFTYVAGREYRVRVAFDMDNATYDLLFDDVVLTAGRAHGVTGTRGVGRLINVIGNGAMINEAVITDNLRVEASDPLEQLSAIFQDGFE